MGTIQEYILSEDLNVLESVRLYTAHQGAVVDVLYSLERSWLLSISSDSTFSWSDSSSGVKMGFFKTPSVPKVFQVWSLNFEQRITIDLIKNLKIKVWLRVLLHFRWRRWGSDNNFANKSWESLSDSKDTLRPLWGDHSSALESGIAGFVFDQSRQKHHLLGHWGSPGKIWALSSTLAGGLCEVRSQYHF